MWQTQIGSPQTCILLTKPKYTYMNQKTLWDRLSPEHKKKLSNYYFDAPTLLDWLVSRLNDLNHINELTIREAVTLLMHEAFDLIKLYDLFLEDGNDE